ncbi:MAG: nucleoside phosphorylase [Flavobacteriales bacterium]|nr:nucleoside phosphorylase [Flavobacteriales bacterium]MCX7768055.1 nucleoside phosphorylase [Flavobacteriales bacterium]MDW8409260.1 nucleoside phosphorylase [Flavobacteriales bacterium]
MFAPSELILNFDHSVYHLSLLERHVADTVITVGDPDRVEKVSKYFDQIFEKRCHREFITHTGRLGSLDLTVISTGIGTDNVDIVLNELDAAVNIDPQTRTTRSQLRRLRIIRVGTTGSLSEDLGPGAFIASHYALGLDNLLGFYNVAGCPGREPDLEQRFTTHVEWPSSLGQPYAWHSAPNLQSLFPFAQPGITLTAPGFYGPQGRQLRIPLNFPNFWKSFHTFKYKDLTITNYEMETAALYGLSHLLGHAPMSLSVVVAHRSTGRVLENPEQAIDQLIQKTLDCLVLCSRLK